MDKRDLVIIDECHNIESIVTDIHSLMINRYTVEENLKMNWVNFEKLSLSQIKDWVEKQYLPRLREEFNLINSTIEQAMNEKQVGLNIPKRLSELALKIDSAEFFIKNYSEKNWVVSVSPNGDLVQAKPLHANILNKTYLFSRGDKFLMMSGTVLDKSTFCETNGIPEEDTKFFSANSPFKVENRQVIFIPVGSMSKNNIETTSPKMIEFIGKILDMHKDDKGIIHAWSYPLAKRIELAMDDSRLLLHDSNNRLEILNLHLNSSDPTVLLSPSFTEGVDLKGDASRFQIIAKVMYPYLGDKYVQTKMNTVKNWYAWQTIKNMIQASGRSVRDYNDSAITYILDADFQNLLYRNKKLFPKWWMDSLVFYN